ncbi:hypothetical protein RND81_10G152400 [Saponaria officinalis]|uniref:Uncharacterized protein n=1 Tax=Saponaria officinalis TaxID=3572 RepID=A0AAW1I309_SAPOF
MSILIMSLLLCLQELNDDEFIVQRLVMSIHINVVELTVKEAFSYLKFLVSDSNYLDYIDIDGIMFSNNPLDLPVPIRSLYHYKYTTISRMKKHLRNTCSSLFSDILYKIQHGTFVGFFPLFHQPFEVPGFPDPIFGSIGFYCWPKVGISPNIRDFWTWSANYLVDEEDRSLYVTFSRGLYVSEVEVKRVFTTNYGDCVQYVDMPNSDQLQALFARVILKDVEFIDMVLRGRTTAKFKIKGKHVWAKKYKSPRIRT